jgi:protein-disulfide isomerase
MNEKGGPVIMVALLFGLFWLCSEPAKKPESMPDSSALIEEVATVKESFTVQPNHIPDATKMIDPQPSPSDKPHEKAKREVLVFVSVNCPPCEKWKRCEMNRFLDAGWSVGIVEVHSYGLTPTFEIESDGKAVTIKGYTTLEQAAEAVR